MDSPPSFTDNPTGDDDADGVDNESDGGEAALVDPPDGTSVTLGGVDAPPRTTAKGSRPENDGLLEAPFPADNMALNRKTLTANRAMNRMAGTFPWGYVWLLCRPSSTCMDAWRTATMCCFCGAVGGVGLEKMVRPS